MCKNCEMPDGTPAPCEVCGISCCYFCNGSEYCDSNNYPNLEEVCGGVLCAPVCRSCRYYCRYTYSDPNFNFICKMCAFGSNSEELKDIIREREFKRFVQDKEKFLKNNPKLTQEDLKKFSALDNSKKTSDSRY